MGKTTDELEDRMISNLSTEAALSPPAACLGSPSVEEDVHFTTKLDEPEPTVAALEEPNPRPIKVGDVVFLKGCTWKTLTVIYIYDHREAMVAWFVDEGFLEKASLPLEALTLED